MKSAKQEREAKFGTRERESWYAKKSFEKARGNAEREEEMKECGHAKGLQERAPSSAFQDIIPDRDQLDRSPVKQNIRILLR